MSKGKPVNSWQGKSFIILFLFLSAGIIKPQNADKEKIYAVEPGTKGNTIILELSNISPTTGTENLIVKLIKKSEELAFNREEVRISKIERSETASAEYQFDISLTAPANQKDTIIFSISSGGMNLKKSIILQYTAPKTFALYQNYPNPFNPLTTIRYSIPGTVPVPVNLVIYDVLGREVKNLVNGMQPAGNYEVKFAGQNYASGIYIYRLTAGRFHSIKKMILMK